MCSPSQGLNKQKAAPATMSTRPGFSVRFLYPRTASSSCQRSAELAAEKWDEAGQSTKIALVRNAMSRNQFRNMHQCFPALSSHHFPAWIATLVGHLFLHNCECRADIKDKRGTESRDGMLCKVLTCPFLIQTRPAVRT